MMYGQPVIAMYEFLMHTQIIAKKPFPDSLRSNVAMYVGCISGAILLQEYQALLQDVGFKGGSVLERSDAIDIEFMLADALFVENPSDLNVYGLTGCCGTPTPGTDTGDLNELASEHC